MRYRYVALDARNRTISGVMEADTESRLYHTLADQGYRLVSAKPVRSWEALRLENFFPSLYRVKLKDMVFFTRQLAMVLDCGANIVAGLRLIRDKISNPVLKKVLATVLEDMAARGSFSGALSRHPQVFPPLYYKTIAMAEHSGRLEEVLLQLADHLEKQELTSKKMIKALAYPSFVLITATVVMFVLATVALPGLMGFFSALKAEVPPTTKAILFISTFAKAHRGQIILVALAGIVSLVVMATHPKGRQVLQQRALKLPILGRVIVEAEMARLARTVSMLSRAGLTAPEIIDIAYQTAGNVVIRQALKQVHKGLLQGKGLARPMKEAGVFPPLMVQMVGVAEEADSLAATTGSLAKYYEWEVENRVNTIIGMLPQVMTLVIGGVVAFLAISLILPMYSAIGNLR